MEMATNFKLFFFISSLAFDQTCVLICRIKKKKEKLNFWKITPRIFQMKIDKSAIFAQNYIKSQKNIIKERKILVFGIWGLWTIKISLIWYVYRLNRLNSFFLIAINVRLLREFLVFMPIKMKISKLSYRSKLGLILKIISHWKTN